MPRRIEHRWFRSFALETLGNPDPDGFNAYKEFGAQEHWCWYALRALCASTEMQPVICVTPYVGYTDKQLADLFKVDVRTWISVKMKLEVGKKIEVDGQGVIRIVGWDRYGGRYFQGRMNRDKELEIWTAEDDEKKRQQKKEKAEEFKRVIEYMNQVTGKHFRIGSLSAFKHFSARVAEGATEKDFRHVIEVKSAQWVGHPDMEKYIRPETFFNSEKFWGYANEPAPKRKLPIGGAGSVSVVPEEAAKYEAEAKEEYDKRMKAAMEKNGWKSEAEIDWFKVPTFQEFFKAFIEQKRKSKDWSIADDD